MGQHQKGKEASWEAGLRTGVGGGGGAQGEDRCRVRAGVLALEGKGRNRPSENVFFSYDS